jgi:mannan endo-1,6-alpha-mannosidase
MKFYKSIKAAGAAPALLAAITPKDLDVGNAAGVRSVAATIAHGTMSYYTANVTKDPGLLIGDLSEPYYWWQAGAMWGSMLDYYHYTGDPSYNDVILEALLAKPNTGDHFDFMPTQHHQEEGNDDLGFWGYAVMSAAERNFPQPNQGVPSWLDMGKNIFDSLESRWNTSHCGGGLLWQIFPSNPNGMNYKNSVSNGGFFQIAARLARATGDKKYLEWAEKVWDWSEQSGLIQDFNIYDGADARDNCTKTNFLSFTYSTGIYLYGAAVLANHTGDQKWVDRASGVLNAAKGFFWSEGNAPNAMYEPACETVGTCDQNMKSFKGYLARFMWQSTYMVPALTATVRSLLETSALAAAQTCTGGKSGTECGQKWYAGGHDGSVGLGQQMCALETIQGLLIRETKAPFKGSDIKVVRDKPWAQPTKRAEENSATLARACWPLTATCVGAVLRLAGIA